MTGTHPNTETYVGQPCLYGHAGLRYQRSGSCVYCQRLGALRRYHADREAKLAAMREWYRRNPGKAAEYSRNWYYANPERARETLARHYRKKRGRAADAESTC